MPSDELNNNTEVVEETSPFEGMFEPTDFESTESESQDSVNPDEEVASDTETVEPTEETVEESVVEESPVEPVVEASANTQAELDDKSSKAFAQFRVENKRKTEQLNELARLAGFNSPEEHLAHLQSETLKREAEEAKVPIEVYQRLKALESDKQAMEFERTKLQFQGKVNTLKNEFNLNDNDLDSFFTVCVNNGIMPHESPVGLDVLYRGLNFETLVEQQRQSWIASQTRNKQTSTSINTGKGQPTPPSQTINTMEDFEKLLSNMK